MEGSSSSPAPSTNDDGRSSAPSESAPQQQPVKAPSSQGPSGPETGPQIDLGSFAKKADSFILRYGVLGEARPNPADQCGPSAYEYIVDRKTWHATAKLCYPTGSDGHAEMIVTTEKTLTTNERVWIEEELGKLEVGSMPSTCGYDGPAYEVEMLSGATSTRYWDADYNCQHLTNVAYVTDSFGTLRSRLHDVLMPGG